MIDQGDLSANRPHEHPKNLRRAIGDPADTERMANGHLPIPVDPYRAILFPNAIRQKRQRAGIASLLALSELLPSIPYIRLSKLERGEVFARATELIEIARVIGMDDADELLVDVEEDNYSIGHWVRSRGEIPSFNREAEELAILLAAAFRARRARDPSLTLATLQENHGLAAVIVSRIENAVKPFNRWNGDIMTSLCTLFAVKDRVALSALLREQYEDGVLAEWIARIAGAADREARTRERFRALRAELKLRPSGAQSDAHIRPSSSAHRYHEGNPPILQIVGVPLGDGLLEPFPNPQHIAPPPDTGPKAYALRMCRASLGAVIPGGAVLIVDPDRYPVHGGLAVLDEGAGLRVLTVTTDYEGHLHGHSSNPKKDIPLDAVEPSALAAVTAVLFP